MNSEEKRKRNTIQKIAVKEYLKSVRTHPTAEEIYMALKKRYPSITLATVYRNLHSLAEDGEILMLKINNEYHFDGFTHPHIHFVCSSCNTIYDIENESYVKKIKKIINDLEKSNLRVHFPSMIFYGICNKCNKR